MRTQKKTLSHHITRLSVSSLLFLQLSTTGYAEGVPLVSDGKAVGVIVLSDEANIELQGAVESFVRTIKRSTGAEIPVTSPAEEASFPKEQTRFFIGPSNETEKAGIKTASLVEETYRLIAKERAAYLVGKEDAPPPEAGFTSRPTKWGLNHLLEKELGVRWLWPGELGTYVPRHTQFTIPTSDITYQPKLEVRRIRFNAVKNAPESIQKAAYEWGQNHQLGRRGSLYFREPFVKWWEKYSEEHPDLFAVLPRDRTQPYPKPTMVKLRLANPKVLDFVAREYKEAGAPDHWSICPNDGSGFDISPETLAWDVPQNQPIDSIVYARGAELTARYVKFWNLVYLKLKEINPNVKLSTYAYSSYRNPPKENYPLTAKMVISVVDSFDAYEAWQGWSKYATGMYLRPNWWHQGADAPYIPLAKTAKYIKFASDNGMVGMDMDSIIGYWANQGITYYLGARLMTRPDLSRDDIVGEFSSAFGSGAPKIREYIDYWEKLSNEYNYPINAGGAIRTVKSKYEDLVREKKISLSILQGSKQALPYLYSDKVVDPALKLLAEAENAIGESDKEALERVEFLREGLEVMKVARDQMALGMKLKENPTPALLAKFKKNAIALDQAREGVTDKHVIWDFAVKANETQYRIKIRPENFTAKELNLEGQ